MDNTTHTMCLHYRLRCARDCVKLGVFVTKRTICSYEYMKITYENRGVENNMKEDHHSYRRNFCSVKRKSEKKFRLVRDSNP